MQYLDINGVQVLWAKIKNLAAAGKTVVSIDTTAEGAFAGFTMTSIEHNGQNEDGHMEYKFSLTDVQSASGLATILGSYVTNSSLSTTLANYVTSSALATELTGYATSSDLSEVSGKVTTLIGSDNNKSVRTIAAEELAAQLIPQNAQEALDTLQEIAAWIQSHPADASAMNARILALEAVTALPEDGDDPASGTIAAYAKGLVDDESTRAQGEEARIDALITAVAGQNGATENGIEVRLSAVETILGQTEGEMSIAEQVEAVQNAISSLDWDAETSDNGENGATHVLTGIHIEDGQLLATGGVDEIEIAPISSASLNTVLV